MHYLVVGAGNIGRCLISDILGADQEARITAIDNNELALDATAQATDGRVSCCVADVSDPGALLKHVGDAAVIVNTTDGSRSIEILRTAIEARVPYLDVHGTLLVDERLALSAAAEAAGITALIGMGCSPGITNMLAGYGARNATGAITVEVEYVTHRPMNPTLGLLDTALRQFRNHVRSTVYENGTYHSMEPFEGLLHARFPGLEEEVELVYTPHSEPVTLPRFVPGLKKVTVRGAYQPKMMSLLKALYGFGLMQKDLKVTVGGVSYDFQPILRDALMGDGSPKPAGVTPLYLLRVRVTGEEKGRRAINEMTVGHPHGWDPLPQGRMTALPASFTAQMIARREFRRPGVCGPETFTDNQVEQCLAYLEARGLWKIMDQRIVTMSTDLDAPGAMAGIS
jgi:saccharopine dehydrogenase-like NADP-dependent oxidoreductase